MSGARDTTARVKPPPPILTVPSAIRPFYLEGAPARGQVVRLGPLADALLTRHDLPEPVARLLGEALALTAGLAAALKFEGSFSMQTRGSGPVGMLLADCTGRGALRGYARADVRRLAELGAMPDASTLLGSGHLAFTLDQGPEMERYQGIVPLEGRTLADVALTWFSVSQQLEAAVMLAAAQTAAGWRAGALLIERIAFEGGEGRRRTAEDDDEAWRTAAVLARAATIEELLDETLPAERLLWRLFHELDPRIQPAKPLSFGCRCSRERIGRVLAGFGAEDLDHMAEDGTITVTCEFCNVDFRFDRGDVAAVAGGVD